MNNNHDSPPSTASPYDQPPALSPRRLAARRANAQKCTGPRTSEGKAAARLNALKHCFFSCDVVNLVLDGPARVEEFNSILDALLEEYQPQSSLERILVDEVAACCWRIRRLLRYECRESWVKEDDYRRAARTESPARRWLPSMGYDRPSRSPAHRPQTPQRRPRCLHSAGRFRHRQNRPLRTIRPSATCTARSIPSSACAPCAVARTHRTRLHRPLA